MLNCRNLNPKLIRYRSAEVGITHIKNIGYYNIIFFKSFLTNVIPVLGEDGKTFTSTFLPECKPMPLNLVGFFIVFWFKIFEFTNLL